MHPFLIRVSAVAALLPALATAQSLPSPTATRQATTLQSAPAPAAAPVSSRLSDRPPPASDNTRQPTRLQSAPLPKTTPLPSSLDDRAQSSQSPAQQPAKARPSPANDINAATDRQPVKLYDRGGRLIPGAVKVGPNRVLDTRSGRYYSTVPSGDGQRIDE